MSSEGFRGEIAAAIGRSEAAANPACGPASRSGTASRAEVVDEPHDAFLAGRRSVDFAVRVGARPPDLSRRLPCVHLSATGLRADAMALAERAIRCPSAAVRRSCPPPCTDDGRARRLVAIAALVALRCSVAVRRRVMRRMNGQFVLLPAPTATPVSARRRPAAQLEPTARPNPGLIGSTTGSLAVTHGDGAERSWIESWRWTAPSPGWPTAGTRPGRRNAQRCTRACPRRRPVRGVD
jgi:hypothetical protein